MEATDVACIMLIVLYIYILHAVHFFYCLIVVDSHCAHCVFGSSVSYLKVVSDIRVLPKACNGGATPRCTSPRALMFTFKAKFKINLICQEKKKERKYTSCGY